MNSYSCNVKNNLQCFVCLFVCLNQYIPERISALRRFTSDRQRCLPSCHVSSLSRAPVPWLAFFLFPSSLAANTSIQVPRRGFEGGLGMLALLGHFHATCKLLSQADWEEWGAEIHCAQVRYTTRASHRVELNTWKPSVTALVEPKQKGCRMQLISPRSCRILPLALYK